MQPHMALVVQNDMSLRWFMYTCTWSEPFAKVIYTKIYIQIDRSICGEFGQQQSKKKPRDNFALSYLAFLRNVTYNRILAWENILCPQQKVEVV